MTPRPSVAARVQETVRAVQSRSAAAPVVGVVLGSGLGAFGDTLTGLQKIPYETLPHMPAPKVVGHAGHLCLGESDGVPVVCMQGRAHLYEGHDLDAVVHGVRTLAGLGVRAVLITNAAGGVEPSFRPGDLMLIQDHLNLTGRNPLVGPHEEGFGVRFPDMTDAYDPSLQRLAQSAAAEAGVPLRAGVYAWLTGPSYETPAEIRMLQRLGAHAVGMSTVPEVIALRHLGVPVGALSCITNLAAGLSPTKLSHAEVEETARASRASFLALLTGWIRGVGAKP